MLKLTEGKIWQPSQSERNSNHEVHIDHGFCELVKGQESEETGYGIAPYLMDNEHPIVKVTPHTQTVRIGRKSYTFEEFINMEECVS